MGFPKTGECIINGKGSIVFHASSNGLPSKVMESVMRGMITMAAESNIAPEIGVRQNRQKITDMM